MKILHRVSCLKMTSWLAVAGLIFTIGSLAAASSRVPFGMNDATIIFPLATFGAEMDQMLAPSEIGALGPVLPRAYINLFYNLDRPGESDVAGVIYENLRLVGVRIDPCFSEAPGQCLKQVRMVWQPLEVEKVYGVPKPNGILSAADHAFHSFYVFRDDSFSIFLQEYKKLQEGALAVSDGSLKTQWSTLPLQIHPLLLKSEAFQKQLIGLLTKYCGEKNLWRVTGMKVDVVGDLWTFLGFNVREGKATPISIPRTETPGATIQTFKTSTVLSNRDYAYSRLSPPVTIDEGDLSGERHGDDIRAILSGSSDLERRSQGELIELGKAIVRIENPKIHSPKTLDCVSCHTSQVAGRILFSRAPWLAQVDAIANQTFFSKSNMTHQGLRQDKTNVLRALGYFERDLILSRRVIHETAGVVDSLNQVAEPAAK